MDFQHSAAHLTSPKRDLQNALMESKSFRDDIYGSLFQQTGSVETRGESSYAGHISSVSAQLFSSATTTTDTHNHSFNAAYQRRYASSASHLSSVSSHVSTSVENGSRYISANARGHAFSTASQRGNKTREFHQVLPTSIRYPRTSNRNVRSRYERPVTNELVASSTAPAENIQRIDHDLPQSTYTCTKVDANESPPYEERLKVRRTTERVCLAKVTVGGTGDEASRMSNTSDKGTTFGDGAARVGMQLRSSPKVSTSSPLVSPSTIINVPRELYNIDVAATFGVPLTTVGDLQKLINDIDAGKHDELLSELTNEDRMETLEALGSICNSIKVDRNNADVIPCKVSYADDSINLNVDESTIPSDPIVQSVDINKSTSYAGVAGGSAKDQPNVNSNFRTLVADPVFDGVNISIPRKVVEKVSTRFEHTLYGYFIGKRMAFPVVEYYARNNWAKHGLKRIMMNSKGFFFFKFDSRAGLEAVLEGGPWLIRKSPIILKKWSMDTRLLKEELTRIPIWVKLHDVPIQVFEEDGISLIATFIGKPVMLDSYTSSMCNDSWGRSSFARCLIEVNSEADLVDVVTIGIPSLSEDDFTKETIRVEYEWRPPRCDTCKIFGHVHDYCPKKVVSPPIVATSNVVTPNAEKTNDGFQTVGKKKKRKGKSKSTNGGQFTGPSVKHNVRYEPKATTSAPKKGTTYVGYTSQSTPMLKTTGNSSKKDNLSMSNSFSALNKEEEEKEDEEDVENVYDESANLIQNTKAGGSSSFTAAAG
ncbi:zinc knuckle CX2CX4HX4C containing protein [Tanacetum coccineum]